MFIFNENNSNNNANCLFLLAQCNEIACGELTVEWKKKFESTREKYSNFGSLNYMPCEFFYINLKMKSGVLDTARIDSLHKNLYDQQKKIGWQVIKVYDVNGKYIFSHSYKNKIYYQSGD